MLKLLIKFSIVISVFLFAVAGYSQSFFGSAPQQSNTDASQTAQSTMSPDQFKSTVKQLNKQTSQSLSQQAAQALPKSSTAPAAGTAAPRRSPAQAGVPAPASLPAQNSPALQPAAPQRDVYTGFGPAPQQNRQQQQQRPRRQQQQQPAGNWNIQY